MSGSRSWSVYSHIEYSIMLMAGPKGYCLNQITCYTGLRLIIMCITASLAPPTAA
jgi:hypothetical protein